jgi:hypothetical protein
VGFGLGFGEIAIPGNFPASPIVFPDARKIFPVRLFREFYANDMERRGYYMENSLPEGQI